MKLNVGDLLKKKKRDFDLPPLVPRRPGLPFPGQRTQSAPTFSKTPTHLVLADKINKLSQQGMAEPEIVKQLKAEGYSSIEIDRSLRNSLKAGVGEPQLPIREKTVSELRRPDTKTDDDFLERTGMKMPEPPLPQRPRQFPPPNRPPMPPPPLQRQTQPLQERKPFPTIGFGRPSGNKEIQELIEVTVEEKWKEAENKIKMFESKMGELDSRFKRIEEELDQMRKEEYKKEAELSTKVDSYQDSITDISTKMEGMESALKGVLESVLESNRNLSESVRVLKKKEE